MKQGRKINSNYNSCSCGARKLKKAPICHECKKKAARKSVPGLCEVCGRKMLGLHGNLCNVCWVNEPVPVVCPKCLQTRFIGRARAERNRQCLCHSCSSARAGGHYGHGPSKITVKRIEINRCVMLSAKEGNRCGPYHDCRYGFWADFLETPRENRCCDAAVAKMWLGWVTEKCDPKPLTPYEQEMVREITQLADHHPLAGNGCAFA